MPVAAAAAHRANETAASEGHTALSCIYTAAVTRLSSAESPCARLAAACLRRVCAIHAASRSRFTARMSGMAALKTGRGSKRWVVRSGVRGVEDIVFGQQRGGHPLEA